MGFVPYCFGSIIAGFASNLGAAIASLRSPFEIAVNTAAGVVFSVGVEYGTRTVIRYTSAMSAAIGNDNPIDHNAPPTIHRQENRGDSSGASEANDSGAWYGLLSCSGVAMPMP